MALICVFVASFYLMALGTRGSNFAASDKLGFHGFENMSLLRKPSNPISAVYNSLKINRCFGDFSAEESYRRGLKTYISGE